MTELYRRRHGGLLRCCIQSLDEQLEATETQPPIGTVLICVYCHKPTLVRAPDGVWEWNRGEQTWQT